jgi:hypothetical protein
MLHEAELRIKKLEKEALRRQGRMPSSVSIVMGVPNSWMVYFMENPNPIPKLWMVYNGKSY